MMAKAKQRKVDVKLPGGPSRASAKVEAWRRANPIRRWLDAAGPLAMRARHKQLRDTFGMVRQAVYGWMHGLCEPADEKWPLLTRMTGVTRAEWDKWFNRKPA